MTCRITLLCDNTVGALSGTLGEHGLSMLIEREGQRPLLFDTGQGATLLHNARRMNRDLSCVERVVLSHGHYDHTGGLMPLLRETGPKEVFAHPGVFLPRFRVKDTGESYPIGLPQGRGTLEEAGARFNLSTGFRELSPGLFLTGEIPRVTPFETGDAGLYADSEGMEADTAMDDQSLVMETGRGLLILLGCCHAGLINTLEHVRAHTGRRSIHGVIGGTHLGFCGKSQLDRTISALRGFGLEKIAASHCTGFSASARMLREFPKEFQVASVGYTLAL